MSTYVIVEQCRSEQPLKVWKTDEEKDLPGTANEVLGKQMSLGNFCHFKLYGVIVL